MAKINKRLRRIALLLLTILVIVPVSVLLLSAAILCVTSVRLPDSVTAEICEDLSSEDYTTRIGYATVNLLHGMKLYSVRVLGKRRANPVPVIAADEVDIDFRLNSLLNPQSDLSRLVRLVRAVNLRYPRLPDSYYTPNHILHPGEPDHQERNEPLNLELPSIHKIEILLENPDILGINPKRVRAVLRSRPTKLRLTEIDVEWPDTDDPMHITGECGIDIVAQKVYGDIVGQARQYHIRPLLAALDIPISLEYIDAFTDVHPPVDAGCKFSVNLINNDLLIDLDLAPRNGKYNGVAFERADGKLRIESYVRGTNSNQRITVGPLTAKFVGGGTAAGTVICDYSNYLARVHFDVNSQGLAVKDALDIADMLNDGTLDCLQHDSPPALKIKGMLAADPRIVAENDLHGFVSIPSGSLFGIKLKDSSASFHFHGTTVDFKNVKAAAVHGGKLAASATLDFPDFDQDKSTWKIDVQSDDLPLKDLAEALGTDPGDRFGIIDGRVKLAGPFHTNLLTDVTGKGYMKLTEGHISRLPLFMGLTDFLAKKFPGIGKVVDQSQSSLDFTVDKGTIRTDNFLVEGSVFSAKIHGSYDIPKDNLDLKAQLQFFKKESLLGVITDPINATLLKALLEFHVYGELDHPKWEYHDAIKQFTSLFESKDKDKDSKQK